MPPFIYINLVGADSRSSNRDHSRSRSRSRIKSEHVKAAKSDDVYVILFAYRLSFTDLACSVDISSEDDTRSVKSTRSIRRYLICLILKYLLVLLMASLVQCRWTMMIQSGSPPLHVGSVFSIVAC
jgi:hypothetical protein